MTWDDTFGEWNRPEHNRHVGDLLPAYLNDTLAESDRWRVRNHLAACQHCRDDLHSWQILAEVTRVVENPVLVPRPSPQLMHAVWAKVDAPRTSVAPSTTAARSLVTWCALRLLLARSQLRVIRPGIWVASTLATLICLAPLLWPATFSSPGASLHIAIAQSFLTPLVTALGLAFLYGPETDAGLEIALSTPVSPRQVLLCRLLLAVSYNVVLSLAVTLAAVTLHGGNFGLLVTFWVGPMLLLSGLSLTLSIGAGAVVGASASSGLWLLHFFVSSISAVAATAAGDGTPLAIIWQTTPATILIAGLLFALAVVCVPHQAPRIAS